VWFDGFACLPRPIKSLNKSSKLVGRAEQQTVHIKTSAVEVSGVEGVRVGRLTAGRVDGNAANFLANRSKQYHDHLSLIIL